MKIMLANPRGFCAGVNMAIECVERVLQLKGAPIYVYHEIVHNSHVVGALRDKGAVFVQELADIPEGAVAILSAHGVAPEVVKEARQRSLRLIDATCPLVTKVHLEVHRFVARGYFIILIGHRGHDEVVGTLGEAPGRIVLVEDEEQARTVEVPSHEKLTVITQTTLGVDDTAGVLRVLRDRFPTAGVFLPETFTVTMYSPLSWKMYCPFLFFSKIVRPFAAAMKIVLLGQWIPKTSK